MFRRTENGLRITGEDRPKRNAYIRATVEVLDDMGRTPNRAWDDAVSLAYKCYGAMPTEDGTIGQHCQLIGGDGRLANLPTKGRSFSLGMNLFGRKIREIHSRLDSLRN